MRRDRENSFTSSTLAGTAGSYRTATRASLGTASLSSSSRFPPSSLPMFVMPVTLPPGRARLSMACLDRIGPNAQHNDGNRLGRILAARISGSPPYHDDINLETHQVGRKLREPIALSLRIAVLDGDVLSFDVAKLAQSQPNCLGTGGIASWIESPIDSLCAELSLAAAPRREEQ